MNQLETKKLLNECSKTLKEFVSSIYQTKDKKFLEGLAISQGVGIGATAGIYGIASLVGTASTGTLISTLSGAAATNATLAWIGGSIFTGTILLAGIAIGSGYIANKIYNGKMRNLEEITEYEKEIIVASLTLIKKFKEEESLNKELELEQINALLKYFLKPLLLKIYMNNDKIISNLNLKYKLSWNRTRIDFIKQIDSLNLIIKDKKFI